MQQYIKGLRLFGLAMIMGLCFTTIQVSAQSPADDPGIGGPGSPGNGPSGDGGPIVPFDGGMSLILAASGVFYASKRIKMISEIKM